MQSHTLYTYLYASLCILILYLYATSHFVLHFSCGYLEYFSILARNIIYYVILCQRAGPTTVTICRYTKT